MTLQAIKAKTLQAMAQFGKPGKHCLRFLITAGPTFEDIDAVRFFGNRSSGLMGQLLAQKAKTKHHQVILIIGPNALPVLPGIQTINIRSAREMQTAVLTALPWSNALLMAAAVADYRPQNKYKGKLRKKDGDLSLTLTRNPDILLKVAQKKKKHQVVIGFSLDKKINCTLAKKKLLHKSLDLIVANSDTTFASADTDAMLIYADGLAESYPGSKKRLAGKLIKISRLLLQQKLFFLPS